MPALTRARRWGAWLMAGLVAGGVVGALILAARGAERPPAASPPTVDAVTVRMDVDEGPVTYRATGFLHSLSPTTPSDALVVPLKPQMFRMSPHLAWVVYPRARRLGARVQIVVSDAYGYGGRHPWPGTNGDWSAWEGIIADLFARARALGVTDVEWDLWNEPNERRSWGASSAQFLETWRRGYRKLRSLAPDAVIVGPSSAGSLRYVKAFVLYARAHDVMPDVLSFHVLGPDERTIPALARDLRAFLAAQGIAPRRLSINEYDSFDGNPGRHVRLLANLERAGVDSAAKSAWSSGFTLDEVVRGGARTPLWWAYRGYADLAGRLVRVVPGGNVDGIAAWDAPAGEARVLLGGHGGAAGDVGVVITGLDRAPGLARDGKIRVEADRITRSTGGSVPPRRALRADHVVSGNQITVVLPAVAPGDAFALRLARPTPGPLPPADLAPPTVAITHPSAGAAVSGAITIRGTAADDVGVSGVEAAVGAGAFAPVSGTARWALPLNTAMLPNGTHAVKVRATDAAGNQSGAAIALRVDNPFSPATGLVGHWAFDEASGPVAADASGNGIAGTLVNGPVRVPGVSGRALRFDGVSRYVALGNPPALRLTGAMTIAAWVRFDARGAHFISKQSTPPNRGWSLYLHDLPALGYCFDVAVTADTVVWVCAPSSREPALGAWDHVAAVFDPSRALVVYRNGAEIARNTAGVPAAQFDSSLDVALGARADFSTVLNGSLDEVRIYNRALSASEIRVLAAPPAGGRPPAVRDRSARARTRGP